MQPMTLEPPSDAELMARVREGDREAFADLVDRHKDAVVTYLARLTADRDRAEDLAQDAFLRLSRAAGDYGARAVTWSGVAATPACPGWRPTWWGRRSGGRGSCEC